MSSTAVAGPATGPAAAVQPAPGPPRVGMLPPFDLLGYGPGAAGAFLAQAAEAGIDHICCGDHVSFFTGTGFDGLVQATALAALHPTLAIYTGVYLLPLRHPVLVARQLADIERSPRRPPRPAGPARDAGVVRAGGLERGCPCLPRAGDGGLLPDSIRALRTLLSLRHRRRRRRVPRALRRRGMRGIQPRPAVTRPRPGPRRRGRREAAAGTGLTIPSPRRPAAYAGAGRPDSQRGSR